MTCQTGPCTHPKLNGAFYCRECGEMWGCEDENCGCACVRCDCECHTAPAAVMPEPEPTVCDHPAGYVPYDSRCACPKGTPDSALTADELDREREWQQANGYRDVVAP